MNDRPSLTERQQEIYDFINERIRAAGYPPTIREIGEHLGIRSTNGVADHLKALKRKGYLQQDGSKSRTWQPLKDASEVPPDVVSVPLLGRVAAGEPLLAVEEADTFVHVERTMVGTKRDVFALKVVGDSMVDAGILEGDTLFVERRDHAESGDIVVALIEQEATVKRYFPEGERIRLQPENAALQPIFVHAAEARSLRLMGVVVGVYRRL